MSRLIESSLYDFNTLGGDLNSLVGMSLEWYKGATNSRAAKAFSGIINAPKLIVSEFQKDTKLLKLDYGQSYGYISGIERSAFFVKIYLENTKLGRSILTEYEHSNALNTTESSTLEGRLVRNKEGVLYEIISFNLGKSSVVIMDSSGLRTKFTSFSSAASWYYLETYMTDKSEPLIISLSELKKQNEKSGFCVRCGKPNQPIDLYFKTVKGCLSCEKELVK